MKEIFNNVIHTLELIEVKGKENMSMLLGCITTLENLRDMIKIEQREIEPEEEEAHADTDEQKQEL